MSITTVDVSVRMNSTEVFTEVEAPGASNASERTIRQTSYGVSKTLNATSVPPITSTPSVKTLTMTGSAVTLDLSAAVALAMPPTATRAVDFSTKKIVAFQIKPRGDNVAAVTVAPGGSNPYLLFGSGNEVDLLPGQELACFFNGVASTLPTVGGSAKNIDFTGTSGDKVDVLIFA